MAEQVDLSKLTDEQLGVYRDLLAKKQAPAEKSVMDEAQPQTFGHGISEFAKQINPLPMITGAASAIAHPVDTARNIYNAQANELSQVPKLVREGRYSEAVGHGAAGLVPMIGPAAAKIGETIGGTEPQFDKYGTVIKPGQAPDPAGGIGAGAGLITSIAAAPAVSKAAGRMIKGIAPPLVKSALGLPGKAEAYGANPAAAVLEDTRGIRPSTIARTGQERLTDLSNDLDTAAGRATREPSLVPARNITRGAMNKSAGFNSSQMPSEVQSMDDFLTKPAQGFGGRILPSGEIADTQAAPQFLGMKRQFDTDFIRNWNPNVSTKGRLGIARQAYGAMADEFNRIVPGAEKINGRIQDLIPAVDRAKIVSRNAGVMEKAMDRISRPTGALVPALIGRQMGGMPGLLAGLGVPEMISAPAVKMMAARGLNLAGKGLASPVGQRLIQAPTLLRRNQEQGY